MMKIRPPQISVGIAALLLLFAAPLSAQQSSVEGAVVNRISGQPIEGVHIRFILRINSPASVCYGATSDSSGRFSVNPIQPGYYTVEWERTGFVPGAAKEPVPVLRTEIELRPGERRTNWKLEMWPLITISGRVVNQYGDPVPNVQIQPQPEGQTSNDNIKYFGYYGIKWTDEKGQFRLFIPPGRYYVAAVPFPSLAVAIAEIRTDGTSNLVLGRTYYPASPDAQSAAVVDAKPDSGIAGLEIRMRSNLPRNDLTVSGVITGIPEGARATISHRYGVSPGQFSSGGASTVGADGRFSINRNPGYVRLLAQCISGDTVFQSDAVEIQMGAPGSENVRLPLVHQTNGTMSGALEFLGDNPSAAPPIKLRVFLGRMEDIMGSDPLAPALASANGAFRITGISPGRYKFYVSPMPENAYIKSILLGDLSAKGDLLDFTRGVPTERIQVTISRNGAEVSGEVRQADGGLALNPNIAVLLVSEPDQKVQLRSGGVDNGHYMLKGVPPGKYAIYAADVRKRGTGERINQPGGDQDIAAAETIEVVEGDRLTRNLKVVQEGVDANPKQ
jgi:protocatechuate 3,4-dioxygenase beta subunit